MKVIHADSSHIDQVVELFDAYRVWYRMPSDKVMAKSFLLERMETKESVIYVCENKEQQLIGFTQLYPIFSSTRMKRMWLLNDLFVHPDFRGEGVSRMLIQKAKELAKSNNACGILLETEKSNDIGNKLYPSEGFELEKNNFYFWNASFDVRCACRSPVFEIVKRSVRHETYVKRSVRQAQRTFLPNPIQF